MHNQEILEAMRHDMLVLRIFCAVLIVICVGLMGLWRIAAAERQDWKSIAAAMAQSAHNMLAEHERGLILPKTMSDIRDAFQKYVYYVKSND